MRPKCKRGSGGTGLRAAPGSWGPLYLLVSLRRSEPALELLLHEHAEVIAGVEFADDTQGTVAVSTGHLFVINFRDLPHLIIGFHFLDSLKHRHFFALKIPDSARLPRRTDALDGRRV